MYKKSYQWWCHMILTVEWVISYLPNHRISHFLADISVSIRKHHEPWSKAQAHAFHKYSSAICVQKGVRMNGTDRHVTSLPRNTTNLHRKIGFLRNSIGHRSISQLFEWLHIPSLYQLNRWHVSHDRTLSISTWRDNNTQQSQHWLRGEWHEEGMHDLHRI